MAAASAKCNTDKPRSSTPGRTASPGRGPSQSRRIPPRPPVKGRNSSPARPRGAAEAPSAAGIDDSSIPLAEGDALTASAGVSRVTVAVRIRPTDGAKTLMRFGQRHEHALRFLHVDGSKSDEAKNFAYDYVFDQSDSQDDIFQALGPRVLEQVVSGHHASVFAYGQTGSGKTYTMLGTAEERGLIPRLCEALFRQELLKTWTITMSFFEIYNEQVVDLLTLPEAANDESNETSRKGGRREEPKKEEWLGVGLDPKRKVPVLNALRVREHSKYGVYVEGLTKLPVNEPADVEAALTRGASLSFAEGESGDRFSMLNLIDLAGSENEAKNINKSLLGLGKCITQLAQGGLSVVPYRESVLTWILKDALGGNAHTLMLCAVDPSPENAEQTLTTLRYADQAKKIVTRPVENIDTTKKMVRELHEQVAALRAEAEAAATAQGLAKAKAEEAEAAAAAATAAAAEAAAEREAALAAMEEAKKGEKQGRSEVEELRRTFRQREHELKEREKLLRHEAAMAAEAAKAAEEKALAMKASASALKRTEVTPPVPLDVSAAVASMSREDKLALLNKLKAERKALHLELGIDDTPKVETKEDTSTAPSAQQRAAPLHSERCKLAFKCFGFLFTISMASVEQDVAPARAGTLSATNASSNATTKQTAST
ncbi:hypothetical protein AB1Y20_023127 [Prymnesium parvum]|uniref:Kinesin-like protein n=1 Tax=Prymnesium parvum TaxID=97485 RepID=A0AB34JD02_PRYPA